MVTAFALLCGWRVCGETDFPNVLNDFASVRIEWLMVLSRPNCEVRPDRRTARWSWRGHCKIDGTSSPPFGKPTTDGRTRSVWCLAVACRIDYVLSVWIVFAPRHVVLAFSLVMFWKTKSLSEKNSTLEHDLKCRTRHDAPGLWYYSETLPNNNGHE